MSIQELAERLGDIDGQLVLVLRAGDADRPVPPDWPGRAFGHRHDVSPAVRRRGRSPPVSIAEPTTRLT
ncbi:MAG: hypothetical protein AVDCRST_MAG87-1643 [uncultured Thermomicrobiales bacterium]|uniref:Uncharacterized protein n=1 Tax=uncultured Thermomicrobiales bacterium TaxID=1645740 RepID=A0A6J4UWG5_9BACT|nr:MAG: hypothetical protein AVDCRST_MAG87-1643 [uncultured Thermomicrobiales bacterium]